MAPTGEYAVPACLGIYSINEKKNSTTNEQ